MPKAIDGATVASMLDIKNVLELNINTLEAHSFFKHTFVK